MWSLGVTVYIMYLDSEYLSDILRLVGFSPWDEESNVPVATQIRKAAYDFPDPEWEFVSDEAKDFICRCLTVDPKKRMTAREAFHHPWIKVSLINVC